MRVISRFLSAAMIFSLAAPAIAFSDVSTSTDYNTAIDALQEKGVIDGYSDGTFKPSANINRAEFLKIVLEAKGDAEYRTGDNCFSDVRDEWFAPYVCRAKAQQIISGYPDGTFKPDQPINAVEAAKIMTLAFGVNVQAEGGDWYVPYMRALETSKAIPPSMSGLTSLTKRGEMAEILWRLTEEKKDQPTKSYLNVKYPELSVNLSSDNVQNAKSCADLSAFIQEAQSGNSGIMYMRGGMEDSGVAAPATPQSGAKSTAESADYSQTNVQVEGVDEADIVKTDGTYVYTLKGQSIRIVQVRPANALKEISIIDLTKDNFQPTEFYLDDNNHLVVIGQVYQNTPYPYPIPLIEPNVKMMPIFGASRTEVRIYDISTKTSPKLTRTIDFEGSSLSSRRIGNKLYLVLNQGLWGFPYYRGPADSNIIPMFRDSARGSKDVPVAGCADVAILPRIPSPQYLIIGVIPLDNATAEVQREVVLGNAQNVYSSLNNLYVSAPEWNYVWDGTGEYSVKTTIYRFAFTNDGVDLKAQGQVPGTILNQFSMDENDSAFRVATNQGQMWNSNDPASNNLYVLNMDMKQVGAIEDIAQGEQIHSVRFMGDRAYMVTFKNIDPFFVIDVSDDRNPKILGQLKIPGYSDYLHPYDDTHIIGFGKEAVDAKDPNFAWYQGMKVAIFDVTDVKNPKEMFKTTIGDRGTDSPLLWNHKALLFDKARGLLAFPITVNEIPESQKVGNDGSAYGSPVFQGAYVYDISLSKGLTLRGKISHYDEDDFLKAGSYWYGDGRSIDRILRVQDSLITVSQDQIRSSEEDSLDQESSVTLRDTMKQ